jgi:predicted nucleic acid-binding protein
MPCRFIGLYGTPSLRDRWERDDRDARAPDRAIGCGAGAGEQEGGSLLIDAVLAATTIDIDANALVSADRAFADVPGLTHVIPDDTGVKKLLEDAVC